MTLPLLITFALLLALVFFSVWCFILNFKGGWVCTTKDLITTFISGGVLGVVVMVFGVTGDIKNDTGRIYAAVTQAAGGGTGTEARAVEAVPGGAGPGSSEVAGLDDLAARLEALAKQQAELSASNKDLNDQLLRALAEMEKRTAAAQFADMRLGDGVAFGTLRVEFACQIDRATKQLRCVPRQG
jgi:hypothetical protein